MRGLLGLATLRSNEHDSVAAMSVVTLAVSCQSVLAVLTLPRPGAYSHSLQDFDPQHERAGLLAQIVPGNLRSQDKVVVY